MKLSIKNLLLGGLVAFGLVACGSSSSGGPSSTNKTISGVALKADGTAFAAGSVVTAVDSNGNTAEGAVTGTEGKYTVTLTGVASSGKKSKLIDGNSFLEVSDGTDSMTLVVSEDQTDINFNAVTTAASQLLITSADIDLDAIFDAAESANGKKGKGEISTTALLEALKRVQVLTKDIFKDSSQSVIGAIFGYDSTGKPAVDVDALLNGKADAKEVTLIKAAADVTGNLVAFAVTASNDPTNTGQLLNNTNFYNSVGKFLAEDPNAGDNSFSSFLNSVLASSEIKNALAEVAAELNALVVALATDPDATLDIDIEDISTAPTTVTVSLSRSGDVVSYSSSDDLAGDATDLIGIVKTSGGEVKATIKIHLISNGTTFIPGDAKITVSTGSVEITVKDTAAFDVSGQVDLGVALTEASEALADTTSTVTVPTTLTGYTLSVTGTEVTRDGKAIGTFLTAGGIPAASSAGVTLE